MSFIDTSGMASKVSERIDCCFSCGKSLPAVFAEREIISITYRKEKTANNGKTIIFHAECFFNDAGDQYRAALNPEMKIPPTIQKQFERLAEESAVTPDSIKDLTVELERVRQELYFKRLAEMEKKFQERMSEGIDKILGK